MKKFFEMLMLCAILAGGAVLAYAQDPHQPQQEPRGESAGSATPMRTMQFQMPSFADLDKNKDKKLSREELPSQWPPQAFDRLDENKDGFIDEAEFARSRQRMGGGPQLGERLNRFLDADKDGKSRATSSRRSTRCSTRSILTRTASCRTKRWPVLPGDERGAGPATGGVDVNSLFQNVDKNKDGKITPDEMTDERMFKALDLNKDGAIPRDEAEQALKQINERRRNRPQPQGD